MESQFSKNLTKYRKRCKLTQGQLAAKLHVTPQAVSKWENGSLPDSELLPMIAGILGTSIDVLFGLQEERETPDLEQLIMDTIRQTPAENRADLVMKLFYAMAAAFHDYKLSKQKYPENLELETYIEIKTDYEGAVARLNEDMKYICFFKIPENGVNSYTEATDNMVHLFETLADKDAIDIIHYLGSGYRNRMQSLEYIAKQTALPIEKVKKVMDGLDRLGLVWRVSAEISDTPSIIYGYGNNTALTGLLILAKSITRYLQFHDIYVDTWGRASFRTEKTESSCPVPQVDGWEETQNITQEEENL
ncbi:MAG: helix-turn-helix domain-containing protein [Ruminococcus sp.]|nr:helix-turn-helix domain-containing protein [Ruminococcus sp.]